MNKSNKCKVCGIDCSGACCSGKCRARLQRTRTDKERTVTAHAVRTGREEATDKALLDNFRDELLHGDGIKPPPEVVKRVASAIQSSIDGATPLVSITGPTLQAELDDCRTLTDDVNASLVKPQPASLADYQDPDGRKYAVRAAPELLNWGVPMSSTELKIAGLTANRVTLPGDWDYKGAATEAMAVFLDDTKIELNGV